MANFPAAGTFFYTNAGTNTLTQVVNNLPTRIYHIAVSNLGGSIGYLQVYNGGSANGSAGTPTFVIPVHSGTAGAGTPSFAAFREADFGPWGRDFHGGLSFLWSAGATGTTAHGVNAIVDITYKDPAIDN